MNPYDFVRVDWGREPERHPAKPHDRFAGLYGRIEGTLTALTPLFLPARRPGGLPLTDTSRAALFCQGQAYRTDNNPRGYFIAGSSLKGLFRSIVETVAQGCFWHFTENHARGHNLPEAFFPCRPVSPNEAPTITPICPACRLFGLISSKRFERETATVLRLGNVGFEDAVCTHAEPHDAIYTAILSGPKPRHTAFYLAGDTVSGRKFYFHFYSDNLLTANGWLPPSAPLRRRQNQFIHPLGKGSMFTFSAEFANIEERDFAALLYALTLEEGMRHKFGYAKPCGLGTIQIQLSGLTLRDPIARYRQGGGATVYEGNELTTEVNRRTNAFVATIPPVTLSDLRRIWRWPPASEAAYRYPTQQWFGAHPSDPISATP